MVTVGVSMRRFDERLGPDDVAEEEFVSPELSKAKCRLVAESITGLLELLELGSPHSMRRPARRALYDLAAEFERYGR